MFANIRDNHIIDFNSEYLNEDIFRVETTEQIYQAWLEDRNKVIYNSEMKEVILNPDYKNQKAEELKEERKNEIKKEIAAIDLQRIRAIAEPSIKDEETGETWLEYYNVQIRNLRDELKQIETDKEKENTDVE